MKLIVTDDGYSLIDCKNNDIIAGSGYDHLSDVVSNIRALLDYLQFDYEVEE